MGGIGWLSLSDRQPTAHAITVLLAFQAGGGAGAGYLYGFSTMIRQGGDDCTNLRADGNRITVLTRRRSVARFVRGVKSSSSPPF